MSKLSRRRFLEDSLLMLAAASIPMPALGQVTVRQGRKLGPNDRIRVAVMGLNGRGMNHVSALAGRDGVDLVAICDADTATFEAAIKAITGRGAKEPDTYQDIRKLLERNDIDAVSMATPNHWHALGAIWAMQAGKDVYLEKPVSHNIFEGRKIVEAARKYGRICQAGTQSRSNPGLLDGIQFIHEGNIGKVTLARGLCYKPRGSIGKVTAALAPPSTVDYDLWLGPAPKKPVMRGRFHYDWHWQWDYGNGDLGNQGSHEMDKARWGLGKKTLPLSVVTFGGRYGYWDDGQTPNTEVAVFDYGDAELIFEVRGLPTPAFEGCSIGNIWYGEDGYVVAPSYSKSIAYDNDHNKVEEFSGSGDHFDNFIEVMRSRKVSDLACDIEEGHLSAALCHLANMSYTLGKPAPIRGPQSPSVGDDKAQDALERYAQHLSENGVAVERRTLRMGPKLIIDASSERIKNNDRANELLTRKYRHPFVVPDKV